MGGKITDIDVFVTTYKLTNDAVRYVYVDTLARRPDGVYIPKRQFLGPASTQSGNQEARRSYLKDLKLKGAVVEGISLHNLQGLTASLFRGRVEPGDRVRSPTDLASSLINDPDAAYCIAVGDMTGVSPDCPVDKLRWLVVSNAEIEDILNNPLHGDGVRQKIINGFVRYGVAKQQME